MLFLLISVRHYFCEQKIEVRKLFVREGIHRSICERESGNLEEQKQFRASELESATNSGN